MVYFTFWCKTLLFGAGEFRTGGISYRGTTDFYHQGAGGGPQIARIMGMARIFTTEAHKGTRRVWTTYLVLSTTESVLDTLRYGVYTGYLIFGTTDSVLYTPNYGAHNFILDTQDSILQIIYSILYTQDSSLLTFHSSLPTLHSTCLRVPSRLASGRGGKFLNPISSSGGCGLRG
jgi:hypothetical protein